MVEWQPPPKCDFVIGLLRWKGRVELTALKQNNEAVRRTALGS